MFWNVQTHHFFYCRLFEQMKLWGRFWSSNMLVFERTHIAIRRMARSSKNMFVSILLNYMNHLAAQTRYRFSETKFANKPKASSLSSRVGVVDAEGRCVSSGTASAPLASFSDTVFSHIIDLWVLNTPFENYRDNYLKKMEARGITRQYAQVQMASWNPPVSMPLWARTKFRINREAKVIEMFKSCVNCAFRVI